MMIDGDVSPPLSNAFVFTILSCCIGPGLEPAQDTANGGSPTAMEEHRVGGPPVHAAEGHEDAD